MADTSEQRPATAKVKGINLPSFTVEFGDDRNRTITLNVTRQQVRGKFSLLNLMRGEGGARQVGEKMSGMPDIPGIRMKVEPKELRFTLYDPLEKKPELLQQINGVLKRGLIVGTESTFVPKVEQLLSLDEMKSLLMELDQKRDSGCLEVVQGELPLKGELESLPGDELYDPWSSNPNKPPLKKDADAWRRRVEVASL